MRLTDCSRKYVVQLLNSFLLDRGCHQDLSRLLFHTAFQTLIECRAL